MTRAGLALAVLIAVYAALLYAPLFFKAAAQLGGHIPARSDEIELLHSAPVTDGVQHDHA